MPNVFISHAHQDDQAAKALADRCKAAGLSVFLDDLSLQPGDDWDAKIKSEMAASDMVWLLASRAALQSVNVHRELGMADAHDIQVIPIIWDVKPEELPIQLSKIQVLNLANRKPEEMNQQINGLVREAVKKKMWQQAAIIGVIGLGAIALLSGGKSGA